MKVYLSGPMTGIENYNFPEFFRIAKLLRQEQGFEVVSPAEFDIEKGWVRAEILSPDTGNWLVCYASHFKGECRPCPSIDKYEHRYTTTPEFDYEEALVLDCEKVRECDGIVLMPGWEASNGARRELHAALVAGKTVYTWSNVVQRADRLNDLRAWRAFRAAEAEAERLAPDRRPKEHEELPVFTTLTAPRPAPAEAKQLRTPEQHEVIGVFIDLLLAATGDGGKKRAAGTKPSWKVDQSHEGAIFSHITKWKRGEKTDPDSGVHPLAHAAWRCLAIAAQESALNGLIPAAPAGADLRYPDPLF